MKILDAVCNLWTPEIYNTRPTALNETLNYFYSSYIRINQDRREGMTTEEILERMEKAGIEKALLIAPALGIWNVPYATIHDAVKHYPDKFFGLAGINPEDKMKGVYQLEFAVKELGFVGAHLYPHWFKTPPNDKIYYPFYAKCTELNIPIEIQIGHCAQTHLPTVAPPMTLDEIAIYFPDLKIIGIHIGWPWVTEAIAVSLKHPNVYIGSDAHSPKYWTEEFKHFVKNRGKNKVIFGSDFPILDFERTVTELADLHLPEEVFNKITWENAARVFNLKITT